MKLLVLGGTIFIGRHMVEAALARGHEVTLFNRGQHNPDLFPEVEQLRGDRGGDLASLRGRCWDAVLDTSGYLPEHVTASADLLAAAVDRYVFISSIAVYADFATAARIDEESKLLPPLDSQAAELSVETYGNFKHGCEQAVQQAMPDRALIIRPGLVVGPHDPEDLFTYWVRRVAAGGSVVAPGDPRRAVQFIDVRDLAAWTIQMIERRDCGVYNATGPYGAMTMGEWLETCRAVSGSNAELIWIPDHLLQAASAQPWQELPFWLPDAPGTFAVDSSRAIAAGLSFQPLAATIRDTLAWDRTRTGHSSGIGLSAEREHELLDLWQHESAASGLVRQR
jgi:2'-hydroxyisoflavone reductase